MNPVYTELKGAPKKLYFSLSALIVALFMVPQLTTAQCDGSYLEYDGVAYQWFDISASGTLVASGDDVSSISTGIFAPVTLGHIFTFYDVPYTQLIPTTNGYISTDPTDDGPDLSNDCPLPAFPSTGGGARIYPLHDDFVGDVYYQYFPVYPHPSGGVTPPMGASVFQWDVEHFGGCASFDAFQAVLLDNGDIYFVYNNTCEGGAGSTTGIQNEAVTSGETYACDAAGSVNSGDAVIYYYEPPVDAVTPPAIVCPAVAGGTYAEVPAPANAFFDISGFGAVVTSGDDVSSGPVALTSPAPYFGGVAGSLNVASNGYVTDDLGDTGPDLSNDCPLPAIPSTPAGTMGNRLYPLHDDLITTVYYMYFPATPYTSPSGVVGAGANIFQWEGTHFGGGDPVSFQVVLFDNGEILYLIRSTGLEFGSGSTSGLQAGDLSFSLTSACDAFGSVADGSAFAYVPSGAGFIASPGSCEAFVPFDPAIAFDACGGTNVQVFNDYNFTDDASDFYPVGTTTVTYYVIDLTTGLQSSCSVDVVVTSPYGPLMAPWIESPLNTPVAPPFNIDPFADQNCNMIRVNSGNGYATPTADQGYMAFQALCGNSSIKVRVKDFQGIAGWVGIQMRETLSPSSKKVAFKTQLGNFIRRDVRTATGGYAQSKQYPAIAGEQYLRLTRTDYGFGASNYFIGEYSSNGVNWYQIFTVAVPMSDCIYVGMFAEDTNINSTTLGVFGEVMVTGMPPAAPGTIVSGPVTQGESAQGDLSVFPNPANDNLNVSMDAFVGQAVQIRMFNAVGQEVSFREIDEVTEFIETFDVSNLESGVYTITVSADNNAVTKRFIIGDVRP